MIKLTVYIRSMHWIIKYISLSYVDIARENSSDERKKSVWNKFFMDKIRNQIWAL